MKKLILTAIALLALSMPCSVMAQATATNKQATEKKAAKQSKTEAELIGSAKPTGRTYTAKKSGQKYQVYQGAKGGLFVVRKSGKTGNWYKQYVKPEQLD